MLYVSLHYLVPSYLIEIKKYLSLGPNLGHVYVANRIETLFGSLRTTDNLHRDLRAPVPSVPCLCKIIVAVHPREVIIAQCLFRGQFNVPSPIRLDSRLYLRCDYYIFEILV